MQFEYEIDLTIPGFEKSVPPGTIKQLSFKSIEASSWYADLTDRIYAAIGQKYLPIYRMADGEFIFCVGEKPNLPRSDWSFLKKIVFRSHISAKRIINNIGLRKPAPTVWGESYSGIRNDDLTKRYVAGLRKIAEYGMLAMHFVHTEGRFSEQYIDPVCSWMVANRIPLSSENYVSFYFVYALLCGPEGVRLLSGRRILIITHADEDKRAAINRALLTRGVKSVQFLGISASKSMLDELDLSMIKAPVDVVLVAAGIGSSNILAQLEPLQTVCIDSGICVEVLADEKMRNRQFTIPDNCN